MTRPEGSRQIGARDEVRRADEEVVGEGGLACRRHEALRLLLRTGHLAHGLLERDPPEDDEPASASQERANRRPGVHGEGASIGEDEDVDPVEAQSLGERRRGGHGFHGETRQGSIEGRALEDRRVHRGKARRAEQGCPGCPCRVAHDGRLGVPRDAPRRSEEKGDGSQKKHDETRPTMVLRHAAEGTGRVWTGQRGARGRRLDPRLVGA